MSKQNINTLAVIASLGGFLFGYDTAVISGTINFVVTQFGLSPVLEGWYVSSALLGCLVGVAAAGVLSDRYGRKPMLILSGILFSLSAIGCMISSGYADLIIYRLIGGIGVGVASMLSPLYISEISPSRRRGRLVALYQFAITIGILCAYFSNAFFLDKAQNGAWAATTGLTNKIMVSEVWRVMLGSETVPALLFLLLLLFIPRSPRWLTRQGRSDEALVILERFVSPEEAQKEVDDIKANLARESGGIALIFQGGFRLALIIGVALAFLTQVSGINAIIYYGPRILEEAGLQIGEALGGQVIIGIINVLFTLIAIWKIDQLGRKPLLMAGVTGITVSLIIIGCLFFFKINSTFLLMTFILVFIACFAFSYGPVIWVLLSEIYPTRIRGTAMSLATFALWIGTTLVGQMTPVFLEYLKPYGTFWLFAFLTLPAFYIGARLLPETKGKTLEEIENYWMSLNNKK